MLNPYPSGRRTLTGAWIETANSEETEDEDRVAPSRVRGLKPLVRVDLGRLFGSHPHGCVD